MAHCSSVCFDDVSGFDPSPEEYNSALDKNNSNLEKMEKKKIILSPPYININ